MLEEFPRLSLVRAINSAVEHAVAVPGADGVMVLIYSMLLIGRDADREDHEASSPVTVSLCSAQVKSVAETSFPPSSSTLPCMILHIPVKRILRIIISYPSQLSNRISTYL